MSSPDLVMSTGSLERHCRRWLCEEALGVDTEFVRRRTFHARLGLIQVASREGVTLLDAVELESLSPFRGVLASPGVVKVFHSCGEDLGVFSHHFGMVPPVLFDTQTAAALVGYGFSKSYRALITEALGVDLPPEQTLSDWTNRPLSEAQLVYAAADVAHLLPLFSHLKARLRELGREPWAAEEFARLADPCRYRVDPSAAYLKLKGAGGLAPRSLAILREATAWREEEAERRDLVRRRVLSDHVLLDIARKRPRRLSDLGAIEGLSASQIRRYGRRILDAVARAAALPAGELPTRPVSLPRVRDQDQLVKRLQSLVSQRAHELGIAPQILARKRTLDMLVRRVVGRGDNTLPRELEGWRREVVGLPALQLLDSLR